jgi:hypothetical protein
VPLLGKLHAGFNKVLLAPDVQQRMNENQCTPQGETS